jgi:hypothetical protein
MQNVQSNLQHDPLRPASKKQLWALFCATKEDHRNQGLTYDEASEILSKVMKPRPNFYEVWTEACHAAEEASELWLSTAQARGPAYVILDEMQGGKPVDTMLDLCAIGGLWFKDKRTAFFKWYLKTYKSPYPHLGGLADFRQEYGLKRAACAAAMEVLRKHNLADQMRVDVRVD